MNRPKRQAADSPESGIHRLNSFLCLFALTALVLKFFLIFRLKIQWDEFYFLSKVYSYLRSSPGSQFQTFHVHFFTWLPMVSDNEVDQAIAARIPMYLLLVGSCIYTYLIGRQFLNRSGALFGLLCYLSLSNIVEHGASFRADSICSFLFLFAVYHLIKENPGKLSSLAAGLAMAIALMVSIKSAFYLMTILFIILIRFFYSLPRSTLLKDALKFLFSSSIAYTSFYTWHSHSISTDTAPQTGNFIGSVFSKVILTEHLFPGLYYFLESLRKNSLIWVLFFIGLGYLIFNGKLVSRYGHRPILLSFLILLTPLFFYRNSFPYFYVFIISPAIVLCGIILHNATNDFREKGVRAFLLFAYIFSISVFGNSLFHLTSNIANQTGPQRQLLATVHEIFPEPVAYIDGCSALGSFPKTGIFMSSWGMENYLAAGRPIFRDLLEKEHPVFILANIPYLNLSLPRETQLTSLRFPLMEKDWDVLRTNFIHHWGILYVLGKKFEFGGIGESESFEIMVPGEYTLESEGDVYINGVIYQTGSTIYLDQRTHTIRPRSGPMNATLRWGKDLPRPPFPPPSFPQFYT